MLTIRFMRMSIASVLECRTDFISRVLVGAIWNITILAFAMVLVTRFPGMGGWAPGDVLLIAAIRTAGHAISNCVFFGMREISHLVHEGLIDAFLLRPASVFRQVSFNYFHVPVIGDLLVVPILFGVALSHSTQEWTPGRLAYLAAAIFGAGLVEGAVHTFLGAIGLRHPAVRTWQEWAEELMGTFGNYPLHILPNLALGAFVVVLPLAFCAYFPVAVLTGHTADLPVPASLAAASPAIGVMLYGAARLWWRACLRRYQG